MTTGSQRLVQRPSSVPYGRSIAMAVILLSQAAIALYLGLPGQMSVDSIIQLYEGKTFHFISINPPLMSMLLGAFDRLGNGPIGFVLLSQALLTASTWMVLTSAKGPRGWQFVVAALFLLNPVILIYVGIVWKDVLLAHAVVFLYLLLARCRARELPLTVPLAILVVVLLTLIVGVRQQGVLFAAPAAIWAATLNRRSLGAIMIAAIVFLTTPIAFDRLLTVYARSASGNEGVGDNATGFKILASYDLVGILANQGTLSSGTPPPVLSELRDQTPNYSHYRVDTLPGPLLSYWAMTNEDIAHLWTESVSSSPNAYLKHRSQHFMSLLGIDDMHECYPVFSGIAGPVMHPAVDKDLVAVLGLTAGPTHASEDVFRFGSHKANTPLFMHLAYAAMLIPLAVWLRKQREYILLTLAVCSLLLLGSYFIVGIACDFRYAYTLTVAASLLAAYAILGSSGRGIPKKR